MDPTDEIISRLKLLGKIKVGDKINTKWQLLQPSGILTTVSRSFIKQDNRNNACLFINDVVQKAFGLLAYTNLDTESLKRRETILADLKQSTIGIKNIIETYKDDTKFGCDMETLLENIIRKIHSYTPYDS